MSWEPERDDTGVDTRWGDQDHTGGDAIAVARLADDEA